MRSRLKRAFGPSFWIFALVAVVSGTAAFHVKGSGVFGQALSAGFDYLSGMLPRFTAALLVAGFVRVLVSHELIGRWLGKRSGIRGLLIAELAGALTPGGPVTAFSLIAALKTAGADRGVLVAYATGWSLLGFQRILVWELPLLGPHILLLRLATSGVIPLLAGLVARRVPIDIEGAQRATVP